MKAIAPRQLHTLRFERFALEISTLTALRDFPGVMPILSSHLPECADEQPWLAMPIATPLLEALRGAPLAVVVEAVATIAGTLAALLAQRGIAHRDVKPGNLFRLDGAWLVGDLGHVAVRGGETPTSTGSPRRS